MNTALIGHTGFVGSNLDRQIRFTHHYNSSNIDDIAGREYDAVFCAGIQAKKWWANQNPAEDMASIKKLMAPLESVKARAFILISTVDVYAKPIGVDEDTAQPDSDLQPYGLHRRQFERFVAERFADHLAVRLPGLFGHGLKKNVIYDLLHDNCLEQIDPDGAFQYYFLDNLSADIERCRRAGLRTVNFATEPVKTSEIIDAFFKGKDVGSKAGAAGTYDVRTQHASLWGRNDGYVAGKDAVLADLGAFIERSKTTAV